MTTIVKCFIEILQHVFSEKTENFIVSYPIYSVSMNESRLCVTLTFKDRLFVILRSCSIVVNDQI